MTYFMPERKYDLQEARKEFALIRTLKHKRSQQEKALASLKKQFAIITSGVHAACGIPCKEADSGMQAFTEFLDLHAELSKGRAGQQGRSAGQGRAGQQGRSAGQMFTLRQRSTMRSRQQKLISEGFRLDDELEVLQKPTPLNATPGYILEPYWTDITTVLNTADICPVRNYSGVIKLGNPPRNLTCPSDFVGQTRKCSRCKQAIYCSTDCQKAHWKLHKPQCKEAK
ncbi:hypothetical protein ABBQ38_013060 [Trebouxia sp. C0009 RCD-2024]